ncbi:MAG: calcium/sodium antiporter [Rhodobacteraceae bacterium]|jgi:cation:H+ antiporter|nr:calcium/sodium antiporter [Paracoccaceae bacterium]
MAVDFLYVGGGLALLILAGDALVRGAVNLSLRLGVPALVVGLTVVAFGTSAPELLVSVDAVLRDQPGIALGNVVGSNIANILIVLGLPAVISAIHCTNGKMRKSAWMVLGASLLFILLCHLGPIGRPHALVLLAGLAFMLWHAFRDARAHRAAAAGEDEIEGADPGMPWWKIALFLGAGLVGLPLGADLLVDGAVRIARGLGVSETVIGLTLVAVGTSLPELATSVVAAIKRSADVALGNVLGSNIFNLLGIIGVAGLVGPMAVPADLLARDLWVMLGVAVLILPFVLFGWTIGRLAGAGFLALYGAYLVALAF